MAHLGKPYLYCLPRTSSEPHVIFCHCARVGDRHVAAAVEAGARTVAQVCKATGAGQQCGSCVFSVRRVLCEHGAPASAPEVDVAAS
jgi:bacterioferritin-associated ferredoxin